MSTAQASAVLIKPLAASDEEALRRFLMSCSKETFWFWNRFGHTDNEALAKEVAAAQVRCDPRKEVGFVARCEGEIAAYGYLRFFPEKPQKSTTTSLGMVVTDRFQGRKVGQGILDCLIRAARDLGMKKIWLSTYTDNERALRLYRKAGFFTEGIFMYDEFFQGTARHVVSMALFLDPALSDAAEKLDTLRDSIARLRC